MSTTSETAEMLCELADTLCRVTEIVRDRSGTHGNAIDQHKRLAAMLTAYLDRPIEPVDAAIIMCLAKISRVAVGDRSELDHYHDLVGYGAIAAVLAKADD